MEMVLDNFMFVQMKRLFFLIKSYLLKYCPYYNKGHMKL